MLGWDRSVSSRRFRPKQARRWLGVVALVLTAPGACSGGGDERLVLDGSPRHPDVEGVVEAVTVDQITLDGGREYKVSSALQSFSTYDLAASPLLSRKGQYVQIGLQGKTAEWMAGIGVVVRAPGADPVVFYNGILVETDGDEVTFQDGTVLTLAKGVKPPVETGPLRAEIEPTSHQVRALTPQ